MAGVAAHWSEAVLDFTFWHFLLCREILDCGLAALNAGSDNQGVPQIVHHAVQVPVSGLDPLQPLEHFLFRRHTHIMAPPARRHCVSGYFRRRRQASTTPDPRFHADMGRSLA
jgi:hypothetical protein